jgi:pimeloyl-ACP methyl ester carboxylesterase
VPILQTREGRVSYLVEGSGPPALLLHGAGVVGEGWRPQLDALRDRFTLITLDNRGIGASPLPPGPVTIERMAADALAVMDALDVRRFQVAGHSMGGLIAQELALTARTRVASLAFLCTFAHGRQGAQLTPAMLLTALRMRVGTRPMRRRAFIELVMPDSYLDQVDRAELAERLRALFGYDLAKQPSIAVTQVRAMSRYDAGERLASLAGIPTLVVSATEDRIARPEFGRELAGLIPGARFVEIPAAGHAVTIQCAEAVNELLAQHWAETGEGSRSGNQASVGAADLRARRITS